jgi:uncharacterized membrane protein
MHQLLLMLSVMLVACGQSGGTRPAPRPEIQPERTFVYECGDYEFVARTAADEIALYLPYDYLVLERERSASGEKYTGAGITFWSKGQEATLDLGTRSYTDCVNNPRRVPWEEARRRGVNFRAIGQEPAWYLEIQAQRQILLVIASSNERVLTPAPAPEIEGEQTLYLVATPAHMLRVQITKEHCTDIMSGEVFEQVVEVSLDGKTLRGCGRSLDVDWK